MAACYFAVCLATFGYVRWPNAQQNYVLTRLECIPTYLASMLGTLPTRLTQPNDPSTSACLCALAKLEVLLALTYMEREKPRYPTGYGTSLAFALAGIMAATLLEFLLKRDNKRKAQMSEAEVRTKYSDTQLASMGEKSPLFKHAL